MIAVLLALAAATGIAARQPEPELGKAAPDFNVKTFEGDHLSLRDFRGQVLILNFWATWCGPCRTELPLLNSYYKLRKDAGLRVLAVTTEDSLPLDSLKPLAAHLAFPMAREFKGGYGRPEAVPTNYIIDRDGVLRYAKAGAFTLDDLNEILIPLLSPPAAGKAEGLGETTAGVPAAIGGS